MAKITVRGVELGYDDAGSGPAVVLLHAGLADRRMWDHQFAALSKRYRVIRYDRPGHGGSGDPVGDVSHHEDLLALLDALGIDRATLVGSSMGGAYSLDAALAAPDRVSAIALIGSGLSGHAWPPAMQADLRERVLGAIPAERRARYDARQAENVDPADVVATAEANVRYLVAGPGRAPGDLAPEVWSAALEMCALVYSRRWNGPQWTSVVPDPPTGDRLAEITVPACVIIGLADAGGIVELASRFAAGIPGAQRFDLPDTGHLPSMERPDEVTAILARFLGGAGL